MEITEVRIKLMEDPGERLQAFCSITFDDCFVIRDLKIIEGTNGPFVAMPSRKLTTHCPQCGMKNHLRAVYCNQCGAHLKEDRTARDEEGRAKLYADIAHPINSVCREMIQERVIAAYRDEVERSKLPGYVPSYTDFDEDAAAPPANAGRPAAIRVDPPARRGAPHEAAQRPAPVAPPQARSAQQPRGPHKLPERRGSPTGGHPAGDESFGQGIF